MNDVDAVLRSAGEQWRAAQRPLPPIDVVSLVSSARTPPTSQVRLGRAAVASVALVAVVLSAGLAVGLWRHGSVGPGTGEACPITRPDGSFSPPDGYVQQPVAGRGFVGTAELWTQVAATGEVWRDLPKSERGYGQKTVWWSEHWSPRAEPLPAISIDGRRLDDEGTLAVVGGTNATHADFGTAMMVGVEVPTAGCWELTATYGAAGSLTIVVRVED